MLAEKIIAHLIKREQVGRAAAWRVGGGTLARTTSTSVSSWAVAPGGAGASTRTVSAAGARVLGTWTCASGERPLRHAAPCRCCWWWRSQSGTRANLPPTMPAACRMSGCWLSTLTTRQSEAPRLSGRRPARVAALEASRCDMRRQVPSCTANLYLLSARTTLTTLYRSCPAPPLCSIQTGTQCLN